MIKACIFDLDGTLVDSIKDLAYACDEMLKEFKLPTHSIEEYEVFVGNGIRKLVERALPEKYRDNHFVDLAERVFHRYYAKHLLDQTMVYEGIIEVLNELKDRHIKLAVVTNKADIYAYRMVNHFFDQFETVYGQQKGFPTKPNPYFVNKLLNKWKLKNDEVIYIGDSDVDIFTGHNALVKTIGCSWGNRSKEELIHAGASIIANQPSDLIKCIQELDNDCCK